MKNILNKILICFLLFTALLSCINPGSKKRGSCEAKNMAQHILSKSNFDTIINNKAVGLFWIRNNGIEAAFTNYGARIIGLWVPNKNGEMTDVVMGMKSIEAYINATAPYYGATIGRVGGRIAKGEFTLNNVNYYLEKNNNGNTLHSGKDGFHNMIWNMVRQKDSSIVFSYNSPHMEAGFPGNLEVRVTYSLSKEKALKISYNAISDRDTPLNLTNHAFFNLNGEGSGTILKHKAQIYADSFTAVDSSLIPTGKIENVENTAFEFTKLKVIGEHINSTSEQLQYGSGYDVNFVLREDRMKIKHAAKFIGNQSGIVMDIYTKEPGVQFYTGNFLKGNNTFKCGAKDKYRTAFAIETQHFPDAPNHPEFPSIILKTGEKYQTQSIFKFSYETED